MRRFSDVVCVTGGRHGCGGNGNWENRHGGWCFTLLYLRMRDGMRAFSTALGKRHGIKVALMEASAFDCFAGGHFYASVAL